MPFYSRHSDDGSDGFLGGMHDEDDYCFFMNMLNLNSSFIDDIERHYDSSDADVIPSSSDSEISRAEKDKQHQTDYHKKNLIHLILVIFVESQCPTVLTNQDMRKVKSVRVLKNRV